MPKPIDVATQNRAGNNTEFFPAKLRDLALGIEEAMAKDGDVILIRPHAAIIYRAMLDHADMIERYY